MQRLKAADTPADQRAQAQPASARLSLYRWLHRIGYPRSYTGKLVLLASLAHLPLLAVVVFAVFAPSSSAPRWVLFVSALLAFLLAGVILSRALRSLLAPVDLAREALTRYLDVGQRGTLPADFTDELGVLMRDVDQAIDRFDEYRQRLEQFAAFDLLTGLLNRRAAEDRLRQTFSLAQRSQQAIVVAMLDLDHFKEINDRLGHAAGDLLLGAVAAQLQASLRGADWAARWGGEEFLLLLHTHLGGAHAALERLRTAIAEVQVPYQQELLACTVSAGAAMAAAGELPAAVVQRADNALYEAKRAGRDRVRLAS